MQFIYRKKFKKKFTRQTLEIQKNFFDKLEIMKDDYFHPSLNNHALLGDLLGMRSFDVTGDIRVHYINVDNIVVFLNIGSHSELYS
jgi:addiction module RelE/StbE family toxin